MSQNRGFTLIELLVVIVIIGLLAALLLPVLAAARDRGRQATCISNLHQIGLALQMYHADSGALPPDYWRDTTNSPGARDPLSAYVRTPAIYHCPVPMDSFLQTEWYVYRQIAYPACQQQRKTIAPAPETVVAYCLAHGRHRSKAGTAPLGSGFYIAARMGGTASRIPAAAVVVWAYKDGEWQRPPFGPEGPEAGSYGSVVFPSEPFPLACEATAPGTGTP